MKSAAVTLTEDQARSIITLNRSIPLRDLEQIIPYPRARDLVLNGPPDVAVYECPCRHARPTHCEPTQVCMTMGQPFVDFVLQHHPRSSRRLTQPQALDLLQAEHERGHVHTAWFKDAALDRFYVLCNCCSCCCGGIEAMTKYGVPLIASSGYVARVDKGLCAACGTCVNACPFQANSLGADGAVGDWQRCMGCGIRTEIGNIGGSVGVEGSFPESYRGCALNGAEILYRASLPEPWVSRGIWDVQNRARAADNTAYMVAPNCGALIMPGNPPTTIGGALGGKSMIVGYKGEVLAQSDVVDDCYVSAEVNIEALRHYRETARFQNWMPYLRTEIYRKLYDKPVWPR